LKPAHPLAQVFTDFTDVHIRTYNTRRDDNQQLCPIGFGCIGSKELANHWYILQEGTPAFDVVVLSLIKPPRTIDSPDRTATLLLI
jgi:hypothetical protein